MSFEIVINSSTVEPSAIKKLPISITFEDGSKKTGPYFDMSKFTAGALTCTKKDIDWKIYLPPLINPDQDYVKFQLMA